jgi:hypothetical protein
MSCYCHVDKNHKLLRTNIPEVLKSKLAISHLKAATVNYSDVPSAPMICG